MAMYLRQNDKRSDFQKRLADDLKEKAKQKALEDVELPDGVKDSAYIRDYTGPSRLLWLWVLLAVVVLGVIFWVIFLG